MKIFEFFKKKFICTKCKRILDKKYLHTNKICVDCFSKNYVSKPYIKKGINLQRQNTPAAPRESHSVNKSLKFSGHSSSHGDQIILIALSDGSVEVYCSNDGYPNRMGSGGYSRIMPDDLVQNYDQERFISWLKRNFWNGVPIDICEPEDPKDVKSFLDTVSVKPAPKPTNPTAQPLHEHNFIRIAEDYDGGFTEFYFELVNENGTLMLIETSYHYNAGRETTLGKAKIPEELRTTDEVIKFIVINCPRRYSCKLSVGTLKEREDLITFLKEQNLYD